MSRSRPGGVARHPPPGFPKRWTAASACRRRSSGTRRSIGAIRLLLTKLTPAERAAYLLRKAFDYPYRRISEVLHLEADHTRQLVRRADERIAAERCRPVDAAAHRRLVRAFLAAAQTGDLAGLEQLLAADVVR
jgi:hypothetical protein